MIICLEWFLVLIALWLAGVINLRDWNTKVTFTGRRWERYYFISQVIVDLFGTAKDQRS